MRTGAVLSRCCSFGLYRLDLNCNFMTIRYPLDRSLEFKQVAGLGHIAGPRDYFHCPNGAEPDSSPLECSLCLGDQDAAVVYFYSATSRRYRGAMWSIFTPALIHASLP